MDTAVQEIGDLVYPTSDLSARLVAGLICEVIGVDLTTGDIEVSPEPDKWWASEHFEAC